jgi:hypothetical protein
MGTGAPFWGIKRPGPESDHWLPYFTELIINGPIGLFPLSLHDIEKNI